MKKLLTLTLLTLASYSINAQTANNKSKVPLKKTTVSSVKVPVKTIAKPQSTAILKVPILKNNLDSACYALGLNVASSFKSGGLTALNYEAFNKGIKDVMQGSNPSLTQAEAQAAINKLFESYSKQRAENSKKQYLPTIEAGDAFLAKNKLKAGIKTTTSGLQYEIITEGTGLTPKATDKVSVNYRGTLLNGEEFDSSYKRNEPTSFTLNEVIPGWTEGVQLMKEGSKYRFFIPYQLAYGEREAGMIKPFSTLIFEIELIKIGGE